MDKGVRFWRWAVILLVLCNIGLMLTIWLKPLHGGPRESPRDFVVRSLSFTSDQTLQYDALVKDHQQAMRKLRHEAMGYRQQLFEQLSVSGGDRRIPDSLAQIIAVSQKQVELVTYDHFAKVRGLCTDAQKIKFDKIIGDVIRKMNGPGPGGGPPGRPGPPGHDGPPPPEDGTPPPPGHDGPPPPGSPAQH